MKILLFIGVCIIMLNSTVCGQSRTFFDRFFRIIPLISTREAVHREFGKPIDASNYFYEIYRDGNSKLSVQYSRGDCSNDSLASWDAEEYVVTSVLLGYRKPIPLSKMQLNLEGYERTNVSDVVGAYTLESERDGLGFDVNHRNEVEAIERFPSNLFDFLLCKNKKMNKTAKLFGH